MIRIDIRNFITVGLMSLVVITVVQFTLGYFKITLPGLSSQTQGA